MLTSYHVHSKLSDGKTSILELAQAAVDAGIDELGISDHYVMLAEGETRSWSMPLAGLPAYFDEMREVRERFRGKLEVRFGIEADYDPHTANELAEVLRAYPFDYVIGSVHFIDGFPVDEAREYWDDLSEPERNDTIRTYWDRISQLARTRLFDFIGHIDLYKKFGHLPTVDISTEVASALDSVAASGMAVEINTAGWNMIHIREAYPSPNILAQCHRRGIPIVINADAHHPSALTQYFAQARELARETGYTHTVAYAQRKARLVEIG